MKGTFDLIYHRVYQRIRKLVNTPIDVTRIQKKKKILLSAEARNV